MRTGLLWFDDDPGRGLEDKVLRAAQHYERKFGRRPDLCLVNPGALPGASEADCPQAAGNGGSLVAGGVEIRPRISVLPHHFWLGLAEQQGAS